jgi:2-polyprenyl-6-methoxyphenol hydroxylase-like FAD-dependent oxidoreductase
LALALAQRGISCAIYEYRSKKASRSIHEGNLSLAPNALRVLDHLGLYETLRSQGFSYEDIAFVNRSCKELGRFQNGNIEKYHYRALRIHRSIVHAELLKRVEQQGIPIYWDKKCVGIESETEDSAVVKFEDGESVTANVVVAADGVHSRVRSFVDSTVKPVFSGWMGIGGTVNEKDLGDLGQNHGLHLPCFMFGENGTVITMPSDYTGKELGFFSSLQVEEKTREEWDRIASDEEGIKDMLVNRYIKGDVQWPELVTTMVDKSSTSSMRCWP